DGTVSNLDATDEGVVELPPAPVRGSAVGLGTAGGQVHGGFQSPPLLGQPLVQSRQSALGRADVGGDARLFGLEDGDVDRAGVVRVQQLAALAVGLRQLTLDGATLVGAAA